MTQRYARLSPDVSRPPGVTRFYRPELDGLRFLAFLAVFMGHVFHLGGAALAPSRPITALDAEWWFRGIAHAGTFGVDLFFALSGYLITTLLLREESLHGRIDIRAFWMRRVLRIWPLYYLFLAVAFIFNEMSRSTAVAFLTFTANLPITVLSIVQQPIYMGILWSIQLEEQFYLLWPLLLVLVPRRFRLPLAIGAIIISIACRAWLFSAGGTLHVWGLRLDALGVGAMLAMVPLRHVPPRLVKCLGALLPMAAILGAALTSQALHVDDLMLRIRTEWIPVVVWVPTMVAVCCGAALWAVQSSRWLAWRPLVHLGRISYGLYLVHYTVIVGLSSLWWPWRVALSFAGSVLIAEISYRVVERPFLMLKDRFTYVPSRGPEESRVPIGPSSNLDVP